MRCWLSGAETKKQRDYFFFFKTWKVLVWSLKPKSNAGLQTKPNAVQKKKK
jgi:hypothetical protein